MSQNFFDSLYALFLIGMSCWIGTLMIDELAARGQLDNVTAIGVLGGVILAPLAMWKARIRFD